MKQHSSKKGCGLAKVFSFINPSGTVTIWLKGETYLSEASLAGFTHLKQRWDLLAQVGVLKTLVGTRITWRVQINIAEACPEFLIQQV